MIMSCFLDFLRSSHNALIAGSNGERNWDFMLRGLLGGATEVGPLFRLSVSPQHTASTIPTPQQSDNTGRVAAAFRQWIGEGVHGFEPCPLIASGLGRLPLLSLSFHGRLRRLPGMQILIDPCRHFSPFGDGPDDERGAAFGVAAGKDAVEVAHEVLIH